MSSQSNSTLIANNGDELLVPLVTFTAFINLIGSLCYIVLLCMGSATFFASVKSKGLKKMNKSLFWLYCQFVVGFIYLLQGSAFALFHFQPNKESDATLCVAWVQFGSSIYVLYGICLYRFLYTRSRSARPEEKVSFCSLTNVVNVVSCSMLLLLLMAPTVGGEILPQGICLGIIPPAYSGLYGIFNIILSFSFIYLFVAPLRAHTKAMKTQAKFRDANHSKTENNNVNDSRHSIIDMPNEETSTTMTGVVVNKSRNDASKGTKEKQDRELELLMRKNMRWSLTALTSTLLTMLILVMLNGSKSNEAERWQGVAGDTVTKLDLFVNTLSVILITKVWIPKGVRDSWTKFKSNLTRA